ncbi:MULTISPECIES: hypothetical protein [Streptacidiphilus]|uniref:Guanylate cyclase domain-containing protein n=1 Tax=Streptacidiphilus cavernicola TaxID=3342716 RepID=A0ABV6ULW0_9ACTN|nr:hypothetical protein [Streptacidiphilus jeojiense]
MLEATNGSSGSEGVYELVVSVDARGSGQYDDAAKTRMRRQLYRVVHGAFEYARINEGALHLEDRGDGVLAALAGMPPSRMLGLWVVEVNELLKEENAGQERPLGLRVGMHVGPVRHDEEGISGQAVDLACRLADCRTARLALEQARADLVLVTSDRLHTEVVLPGGRYIDPDQYVPARVQLKEGPATAWFMLPGRPAPVLADETATPEAAGSAGAAGFVEEQAGEAGREGPDPLARVRVDNGDVSFNSHNRYEGPTHIGRTNNVGGGDRA